MGLLADRAGFKPKNPAEGLGVASPRPQIDFRALAGMFPLRKHQVQWGATMPETKYRVWVIETPGPYSSGPTLEYWGEWSSFPVNNIGMCCRYCKELRERYLGVPEGTIAHEIASGRGGQKIAEYFVSEYFEGGDIDGAHIKAELFGVPHDVYERVFKRAQDMGAGE